MQTHPQLQTEIIKNILARTGRNMKTYPSTS